MAYSTTASLDKPTYTDHVDFGKSQDSFRHFLGPKGFQSLGCKAQRWQQKITTGTKSCNVRGRFQPVIAIEESAGHCSQNFGREKNLTPVVKPTMSKDMDEQLNLAHKVVDVADGANRQICVTLLRYSVDKPESSHAQVQLFARQKEDEKFQRFVNVN